MELMRRSAPDLSFSFRACHAPTNLVNLVLDCFCFQDNVSCHVRKNVYHMQRINIGETALGRIRNLTGTESEEIGLLNGTYHRVMLEEQLKNHLKPNLEE